ncbi:hypothetical protein CCMSSC00406_0008410 [Pleurotus cornucopiae]|uniref:Uncharacterized protein n=1 Tax=Pleurotus cornucopiae TaxID=5321 RepID=A0ACB7JAG8_PLECO|nr:hypothetical protein CCMSSC00406_0008410 [Pleurotus cornucopiae]
MICWQGIFVHILTVLSFTGAKFLSSSNELNQQYDFIVVGGGTAGNVLANRLSQDEGTSVLLIEAGGQNDALELEVPYLWPGLLGSAYDWNSTSTPQAALDGRTIGISRGFVLGGTSSINAMLYTRGSSDNYNNIATLVGDEGWSWNSLQPYIHEDATQIDTISVTPPQYIQPIDDRVIQTTAVNSEFPYNAAPNAGDQVGMGWSESTIDTNGRRISSATAYLTPAVVNRPNLDILLHSQVTRLLSTDPADATKFTAVEFVESVNRAAGAAKSVSATKEIILSAGTFGTPPILLHSGVGDAADLTPFGITPVHQLPSVGKNLTDHLLIGTAWFANSTDTYETVKRNATLQAELLEQWQQTGTGAYVNAGIDHVGCIRIAPDSSIFQTVPDPAGANTGHFEFYITNGNVFGPPGLESDNFIAADPAVLSPLSRGSLTLLSADPLAAPSIDPAYMTHPWDLFVIGEAVRSAQRFFSSAPWNGYVLGRAGDFAALDIDDDDALHAFLRANVASGQHPVGTASMSPRGASWGVVDPDLKVKGLNGLRIVDASVIPLIPAAHTQAMVYIYAERAADIIKAEYN